MTIPKSDGVDLFATVERAKQHGSAHAIRTRPVALLSQLTAEGLAAQALLRAGLGEGAIWNDYLAESLTGPLGAALDLVTGGP
jgi:hypothetical protein